MLLKVTKNKYRYRKIKTMNQETFPVSAPNAVGEQDQSIGGPIWQEEQVIVDAAKLKVETDFARENLGNQEEATAIHAEIEDRRRRTGHPISYREKNLDISFEPYEVRRRVDKLTGDMRDASAKRDYKIAKLEGKDPYAYMYDDDGKISQT
jgi:hypothetical protein